MVQGGFFLGSQIAIDSVQVLAQIGNCRLQLPVAFADLLPHMLQRRFLLPPEGFVGLHSIRQALFVHLFVSEHVNIPP